MRSQIKNANKVAQITLLFWIMKIIATTLGETLGDYFSMTVQFGYLVTLIAMLIFFLIVLSVQLLAKKYVPVLYWLVIISTTTLGTEISDFMDRSLRLGYAAGSLILFIFLITTLFVWKWKFKSLQVFPIYNRSKEIFYWVAILFSNSLGTAFGDFLSDNMGLSFLTGALITASIIVVVILLHYFTRLNEVALFWIAFVFTRPFGATFGDFLTKPLGAGGLNLGTLPASITSIILMTILIIISHRKQSKGASENSEYNEAGI
jgi:uncharacterized membrane-anchored protein